MANNWMNMLNPLVNATKKFVHDLIGVERYARHADYLDDVSRNFGNREYENFAKLIAEVYEAGYVRSVEEHRKELARLGLKVNVSQKKPANPIFPKNSPDSP